MKAEGKGKYSTTLSLTSALDVGYVKQRSGRFTAGNCTVSIAQENGWGSGPVWTEAENLAHAGILSPNSPARSQSLYRQSYRGSLVIQLINQLLYLGHSEM
jgi:hypothetical protein